MLSSRSLLRGVPAATRAFSSTARAAYAKVIIVGRIAHDPETSTSPSGTEYVKYVIGSRGKRNGEDSMSWFRVSAFNDSYRTYIQTNIRKGALVYFEGEISLPTLTSEDGSKRQIVSVTHRHCDILQKGPSSESESESESSISE